MPGIEVAGCRGLQVFLQDFGFRVCDQFIFSGPVESKFEGLGWL